MPYCPQCRGEYRRNIEVCAHCQVPLVEQLPEQPIETSLDGAQAYIEQRTPLVLMLGALEACREIRDQLLDAGIPTVIREPKEDEAAELGLMHMRYEVLIAEEDLERVRAELAGRFDDLLANEGVELSDVEVHLDDSEVTCPACGHAGALQDGECAECGLFLGVAE